MTIQKEEAKEEKQKQSQKKKTGSHKVHLALCAHIQSPEYMLQAINF